MARRGRLRPLSSQVDGEHALRPHHPQRTRRHRMREHAIHQPAATNFNGQEHSRISATCSHRVDNRTGGKDRSFSRVEIGCGHTERDAQFLECLDLQSSRQEGNHAVVRCEAVTRECPASEGSEANFVGDFFQFRDRDSAAICGADERAYTGARNHANRNAFFFEDLENPNMCDAAGKATTQGDTNRGYALGFGPHTRCAGEFASEGLHGPNNLGQTLHGAQLLVCRCRKPSVYIYKMPRTSLPATAPLCYVAGYRRIRPALLEFQYLFRVTNSCNPVNLPSVATGRQARFVSPNYPLEASLPGALRVRLAWSAWFRCR